MTLDVQHDDAFELGRRINERWPMAYMNGYNWEALIHAYVSNHDPGLAAEIESDPEAGMYVALMRLSSQSVERMKRFERLVRDLLGDESALMSFVAANDVPWD